MNAAFIEELKKFVSHPAISELFKSIVQTANKNENNTLNADRRMLLNQIEEQNHRIAKSRALLL